MSAFVYLIHIQSKIHHAQHYLGYTAMESVDDRLKYHRNGNGAKLLRYANLQGIKFAVVRVWECGNYREAAKLERKLKNRKESPKLCPVCQGLATVQWENIPIGIAIAQPTDAGIPF